ncbi:divergent PAP2 family protein [Crassaminicella thermophila]|uniref:Divergent PAP2 family protein n=1 Tax=Crassaminicella thermophila TaxID=2599308 RepID=A0A5C0SEF0_CRATE|nr:divergent PAP2 family protein [Crassaminicella thermophila]QEK12156.1 divergent PAP2 family protein [Crassaminicella thermophila]
MHFFQQIGENDVLYATLLSWFIAQLLKVIITLIKEKKVNLYRFVGSGGMPSSHSSLVMGLSTAIGLKRGWNSTQYALALAFALIVMYDASGVRRAVGKQAIILNKIIEDRHKHKPIGERRLKELIGHTPVEVVAGALLGILIANMVI